MLRIPNIGNFPKVNDAHYVVYNAVNDDETISLNDDLHKFLYYEGEGSNYLATNNDLTIMQQQIKNVSEGKDDLTINEEKPFFDMNTS